MKKMVVKRKRKDVAASPSEPAIDTKDEERKRTKVHAQRKFAQGQQGPKSAYLSYNLTSGQSTPEGKLKENSNTPPVDVLPNIRPNTEDFLTFLCFRGTNMLPKNLDYYNQSANQPSTSSAPSTSTATTTNNSKPLADAKITKKTLAKANENNKKVRDKKDVPESGEPVTLSKSGLIPGAARKRAEMVPEKNDKKKHQFQNKKMQNDTKQEKSVPKSSAEGESNERAVVVKNKRKSKLNNAGSVNSLELDKSPAKTPKLSIEPSGIQKIKQPLTKPQEVLEVITKNQITDSIPPKKSTPKKPTTRLSALRNNPSPDSKPDTDLEFGLNVDSALKKVAEFSSDDDEPLIMSKADKKKDLDVSKPKKEKSAASNISKNYTNVPSSDLKNNKKLPEIKNKHLDAIENVNDAVLHNKSSNLAVDPKNHIVKLRGRKKNALSIPIPEKKAKVSSDAIKKGVRKKKMSADAEITELSQANTTDLSENEGRTIVRPSRKTKEAATIYMELIGRKLTLHDFSDNDASSLDSLELPNFKAQIEMERKAIMDHQKESPIQEKKDEGKLENFIKKNKCIQKVIKEKQIEHTISKEPEIKSKKLENSFSDSDEEPLATKVRQQKPIAKKRGRKSAKELAETKKMIEFESIEKVELSKTSVINKSPGAKIITKNFQSPHPSNVSVGLLNRKTTEEPSSTKQQNQTNDKFSKLFQQSIDKPGSKLQKTGEVPFNRSNKLEVRDDDEFVRNFENTVENSKPINLIPRASIDLLPSKEESEKIFGIASVTLAQSSGPLDTKCTLGKCGSVHKPPLGPAILTESALGASLAPKDRRKSKVNMTRLEIHRWLDESTWTPIKDDLDLDDCSTAELPSKTSSINHTDKVEKIEEKPSTSKGPTLKAKPVAINYKQEAKDVEVMVIDNEVTIAQKEIKVEPMIAPIQIASPNASASKIVKDVSLNASQKNTKTKAQSGTKEAVNNMDKKPVYKQQLVPRTPVYKTPAEKPRQKQPSSILNPFKAFSPENEHSVYSFDREDDDIPAATPFRRQSRQDSRTDEFGPSNRDTNDSYSKQQNTDQSTPVKQLIQSQISFTLSPEDNSKKSALIPDGINKKTKKDVKIEDKSAAANENDSDSEGHTFYIPLQATNVSGSKNDQLIQGVSVKLGTEGAEGPNQRIIMHAKLVTKSRIGANTQALPDSMTEVVKTLMANKDISAAKSVPCATVQPRCVKSSDNNEPLPGTSQTKLGPIIGKLNKYQNEVQIQPTNNTTFPCHDDPAQMVEAPVFRPTEKEFQDPIEYIERIAPIASRFGICRIIPPESFKPECRVSDEMRFTAYNQYVHKILHRWGPSAKEFAAIKKYLATQSIVFQHPPLIAGMEVDLPRLYHTVQELGGLKEVIEKKKWAKVSEDMCIPKTAHDRVTKLDDIYCKYLLPYDTLSHSERQKLFDEVEADWAKREAKARRNADKCVESDEQSDEDSENDDESEELGAENDSMECMVKGRSMALSQFYRVARNTMALWFKNTEPTSAEIEVEYWRHVAVRDSHVCVHYGSIDSSGFGYGFPAPGPKAKASPCSKHAWNLKVMTNNSGSILRSLGPVMGVTVPTLHVGMLFSAVCWYRDPHGLPWIEYLHTGASKIWYAVPDDQSSHFRSAMTSLVPSHCQNKTIWLPCDTAMVPPYMLTDRNVSLCRTEQEPGQFVVVFPRVYTSSLCTGYTVSESVYFATSSWLDTANEDFKDIQESCEPTMFSLEQLLFAIANDQRTDIETLDQVVPMMLNVFEIEKQNRKMLKDLGVTGLEKISEANKRKSTEEYECNTCRANLHISWIKVSDEDEETAYCLKHAIKYLNEERIAPSRCKLVHTYTVVEIENLLKKLNDRMAPSPKQATSSGNAKKKNNKTAGSMLK